MKFHSKRKKIKITKKLSYGRVTSESALLVIVQENHQKQHFWSSFQKIVTIDKDEVTGCTITTIRATGKSNLNYKSIPSQ
jgi:hypothetical protein